MQIQETITFLRWLCEHEYRIQYSDAAVEVWHYSLRTVEPAVAKQAVLEHYKANEAVVATPGGIAKRAANIKNSREAGQRAIDPPAQPVKHPLSWRARNPAEWDRLFEEGRRLGNEERRRATEARNGTQEEAHTDWMAA
jgi:hypothetical protein